MAQPQLRILVFDFPPLLRDLVRRALDANDDIVTITAEPGTLAQAAADNQPDAVIVPVDATNLLAESRHFLTERARLCVLGLGYRDGRSVLFALRPDRSELGEVAPGDLAPVLRNALARTVTL